MNLSRRGLIVGLAASLVAAPAIVKSASLMPIRGVPLANQDAIIELLAKRIADARMVMAAGLNKNFFGDGPWAEPVRAQHGDAHCLPAVGRGNL